MSGKKTEDPIKFFIKIFVVISIVFLLALIVLFVLTANSIVRDVAIGHFVSFTLFFFALITLQWAFLKSLKVFLGIVFGGMLVRFVFLGIVIFFLMRFTGVNMKYFAVSFALFYLIYQTVEIIFVTNSLSKHKKQ